MVAQAQGEPAPLAQPARVASERGAVGGLGELAGDTRHRVRAGTLVAIRWFAVAGQLATVLFTTYVLRFDLPLIACLAAILASIWFNLVATSMLPRNARLSENVALGWLIFDAAQLATLLALCGGLSNPFSILFLATASIAAAVLTSDSARIAVSACVALILMVELLHLPLLRDGEDLTLPLIHRLGVACALTIGVAFISVYVRRVAEEAFRMSQALSATQLALAREQQLSSMGAMAAAAAHELGTPLATIAVTARELERDVRDAGGAAEHVEDLALIRDQTDRCRRILKTFAEDRAAGRDEIKTAPLLSVLEEAARPHLDRGKDIVMWLDGIEVEMDDPPPSPETDRRPEVIHGLRNLIQNAVDFASSRVDVQAWVDGRRIDVRIEDDGPGFPAETLERLGEPFISNRRSRRAPDGGYEGMGLGIFIAKTLLERRGASLDFFNRRPRMGRPGGGTARIVWQLDADTGRRLNW